MMQLIQMPRAFGKSTHLVHLMAGDDDSVCVVVNQEMVEHMAALLYRYLSEVAPEKVVGKYSRHFESRFFTPLTFRARGNTRLRRKVYVDDLDMVLAQLLGTGVDVATYSPPQEYRRG